MAKKQTISPSKPKPKDKKGPGRPTEYFDKAGKIVGYIRRGMYQNQAAQLAGISTTQLCVWKNKYPEFTEAIKAAEGEAELEMVEAVREHSVSSWQSAAWYLERKFPDRWGKVDRLQIDKIQDEVKELSDDELIAMLRRSGNQGTGPAD